MYYTLRVVYVTTSLNRSRFEDANATNTACMYVCPGQHRRGSTVSRARNNHKSYVQQLCIPRGVDAAVRIGLSGFAQIDQ